MKGANGIDAFFKIGDGSFVPAKGQGDIAAPGAEQFERIGIMLQSGGEGQAFGGLVGAGFIQHMVAAEKNVVQADDHVSGTMSGHVHNLECSQAHSPRFVGEVNRHGLVDALGDFIHFQDRASSFGGDPGLDQELVQAPLNHGQTFGVIGDDPLISS